MDRDELPDDPPELAAEWRDQRENLSTRERVYAVALQLYEPTGVAAIAERADVSKETAREYLRWFAEIGVVTHDTTSPDTFSRNEAYFEWRRIQRLRARPTEELEAELSELVTSEREYRDRFDADGPDDVDALEHGDYDDLESVWTEIQEWRTIRRRIRELERARQQQDGSTPAPA